MHYKNRKHRKKRTIIGILLISISLIIFLSILSYSQYDPPFGKSSKGIENLLGITGAYISGYMVNFIGFPSIIIPLLILLWGFYILAGKKRPLVRRQSLYIITLLFIISTFFGLARIFSIGGIKNRIEYSGILGTFLAEHLVKYLGKTGSIIVFLTIVIIFFTGWTGLNIELIFRAFFKVLKLILEKFNLFLIKIKSKRVKKRTIRNLKKKISPEIKLEEEFEDELPRIPIQKEKKGEHSTLLDELSESKKDETPVESEPSPIEEKEYHFPPPELLNEPVLLSEKITKDELVKNANLLEEKLKDFGVNAKVVEIHPGPVITLYELKPATGVKISKIVSLSDDLALTMKARGIRIIAPIPGKGTVGIEIPNRITSLVYLKSLITSEEFRAETSKLSFALGKNIGGETFIADLSKMPHILIAGSTGSGKSVGINTIITSILFKARPEEVQFILIDPKKLELSLYKKLKHHHLLTGKGLGEDVITTPENAVAILRSVVYEMEKRYEILAKAGVRNIDDFNIRFKNTTPEEGEPTQLPYIIVIIDELADLMLTAGKDIEEPIARIAQMARAVGIHLIVATQRPSVDVITGVIKANFPARMAYQVASKVDSRTILDMNGAETLLGSGDLLFLTPGQPKPLRIQNAFVTTEEIERIIDFISKQPKIEKKPLEIHHEDFYYRGPSNNFSSSHDELFREAMKIVIINQQGSISLLQRRLKIGYSRAARLIDELEEAGVVGPYDG
ncbi:DNA translocase FtsK, partial [candidate division KSB1 bacterium]